MQPLPVLIREAPWVAFERDATSRVYDRWMRQHLREANVRIRVDIFNAMAAVLRTGIFGSLASPRPGNGVSTNWPAALRCGSSTS